MDEQDLAAAHDLAREYYYGPGYIILTHWDDLHPERQAAYVQELVDFMES